MLDLFFLDRSRGWALAGPSNTGPGWLAVTEDGGRKWRRISIVGDIILIGPIWFANPKLGYSVGVTGDTVGFVRTEDGGETWRHVDIVL